MKYSFLSPHLAQKKIKQAAHLFANYFGTIFLYSGHSPYSPSYLFLFPYEQVEIKPGTNTPWEDLKSALGAFSPSSYPLWSGYLSYELGAFQDEKLTLPHSKSSYPLAYFQKSHITLVQDRSTITIHTAQTDKLDESHQKFLQRAFWEDLFAKTPEETLSIEGDPDQLSSDLSDYLEKIQKAKEHIYAGDIYEVNLSRSIKYNISSGGFDLFSCLTESNPTAYSAFMNLGRFEIVSASPECFLKKKGKSLESRPIKGTSPRGPAAEVDEEIKERLLVSPKEDAELMMICDLARNDLGRVSEIGSVNCVAKKRLLTLTNVFHLESCVRSKALAMHPLDLVRSCFPPGSITGCPKIRSMEIIQDLEKRPRHVYCGSIGYFTGEGDFEFSVSIRTAVLENGVLELQVGGAITSDSDLQAEYEETRSKGLPFERLMAKKKSKGASLALAKE